MLNIPVSETAEQKNLLDDRHEPQDNNDLRREDLRRRFASDRYDYIGATPDTYSRNDFVPKNDKRRKNY